MVWRRAPAVARRRANRPERDLRESRERFQLLVESVKDYAIFMLDPTGRVESWNLGAQRIKGYSAAEILGRHFSAFYPPEDIEAGKCELELDIATKSGRFEEEGWRVRKDGTTFWASVVITAVHDRTGLLVGFAKVTRDLTDRIAAEAERLQRVRAEEGERKAAEFLAIMGHELRNPVAPMLTAVELIKLRRGEGCEKEIEVLERQLAHLKRLLDDLLDVSRPSRAETALARREIDVADLVANAIEMASPLVDQRRHQLRVEVRDERLLVDVDPARMAQVLGNLLINAAKYTDPGGHITVRAQREGDFVRVDVVDDGIGISNELMPRLFDAFTQGKQSLERQVGGLGLGLTIVQRLVAEHGGEVFAESDGPGRGSRFSVRLRRVEAPPTSEPLVPVRMAGVLRGGRRVLLVDDNEDSSEMLGMYLEHLGHHVRIALDGPSGLRAATEIQADIAFLDLGLPGMNGYDLATAIRKLPGYEDIPIVAVSGYAGDEDKRAAAAAGFSDHFAKPVEIDRVRQAVDAAPRRTSD